jgi:hypothetical protein
VIFGEWSICFAFSVMVNRQGFLGDSYLFWLAVMVNKTFPKGGGGNKKEGLTPLLDTPELDLLKCKYYSIIYFSYSSRFFLLQTLCAICALLSSVFPPLAQGIM